MSTYAIAIGPVPLYGTPELPHLQPKLDKDHQGLIKSVEVIAFPLTKFVVIKTEDGVSQVTTSDYPSSTPLYVDSRFLRIVPEEPPERKKMLPPVPIILRFLESVIGVRYFWGGNWAGGIPEMSDLYPQLTHPEDQEDRVCKGVDCSGLMYQATNGCTPRNTGQLFTYGQEIDVDQNSVEAVQKVVKPLDIMVWRGHVLCVLDPEHFIESCVGQGVIVSGFTDRYKHFHEKLRAEQKPFSLRRWHPQLL